jgi:hypothetical protein
LSAHAARCCFFTVSKNEIKPHFTFFAPFISNQFDLQRKNALKTNRRSCNTRSWTNGIHTHLTAILKQHTWNTTWRGTTEVTSCLRAATPVPVNNWDGEKEVTNCEASTAQLWDNEHELQRRRAKLRVVVCHFVIGSF